MRRIVVTATITAALLLAVLPGAALGADSAAGNLRVAYDSRPDFSNLARTSERHDYVILQPWETDELRQIKAADPSTKVICHKNLSGSKASSNNGHWTTGVSVQEAEAEHPEWFLKDASGERITFMGYPDLHAMDIGNPAYQRRWADNVVRELVADGWDGVLMDNTDTTMRHDFASYPTKYPSDAEWRAATESALAHIGPRIEAAGKLAIPNFGGWGGNPEVGRDWLRYVSGAMDEMFLKWGNTAGEGYADEGRWSDQLASLRYAQSRGKDFLAVTHSTATDAEAARYGYATMLLGGEGSATFMLASDYTRETWFPEYDYDLGAPLGPESTDPNGVHRRVFANGIVVVNPTDEELSANLNGAYSGSGFKNVSSTDLGPRSGYVLAGKSAGFTIKPTGKDIKGGKVIARGRVAGTMPSRDRIKVRIKRNGWKRGSSVPVRQRGRFTGRIRVRQPGRYTIVARHVETGKKRWPGKLRVRGKDLR
jgi:Hypothetical glycosyl hydrolase family 15